jgi:hypothetical protein
METGELVATGALATGEGAIGALVGGVLAAWGCVFWLERDELGAATRSSMGIGPRGRLEQAAKTQTASTQMAAKL